MHFLTCFNINHINDAADEDKKCLRRCRPPRPSRCDAKERPGRQLLRGVQVLQTGDHQEPHRAALHDRAPQGERRRGAPRSHSSSFPSVYSPCVYIQSESYQEDIYPMTAGNTPALTAEEWLSGIDKGQQVFENLHIFLFFFLKLVILH